MLCDWCYELWLPQSNETLTEALYLTQLMREVLPPVKNYLETFNEEVSPPLSYSPDLDCLSSTLHHVKFQRLGRSVNSFKKWPNIFILLEYNKRTVVRDLRKMKHKKLFFTINGQFLIKRLRDLLYKK